MFKRDENGKESAEQYAEVARFFTESRLLQREVKIILEGSCIHIHTYICTYIIYMYIHTYDCWEVRKFCEHFNEK